MNQHTPDTLIRAAVDLAKSWQDRANELLTAEEKGIQDQLRRLLSRPLDKVALTRLIDQSFRSENTERVADQINFLLREYGVPEFFSSVEKLLVQMFLGVGRYIPSIAVPKIIEKMRHDSSRAIIPGEPGLLKAHLDHRRSEGVRMNINHLGEALLGEDEARLRLKTYIADLENPDIECISVKISTIYSQINSLAFTHTLSVLEERLSALYRAAGANFYTRPDGVKIPKSVNLDMEEYRDLEITAAAFTRTLDKDEFLKLSAGIALQAYLPDSFEIQRQITEWARARLARGGSPVKIRLVKGANMEMEMEEASLQGWPLAPYDNKLDVDANFKRMVEFGMQPDNIPAAHLGIGSHNLFDLAYAYLLAKHFEVDHLMTFEMLEGMADHVRRAISEISGDVLLYAPIADKFHFINAIAYLIRRLDENTAEENFLCHAPHLSTDSEAWAFLTRQFMTACDQKDRVGQRPHRTQNRNTEDGATRKSTYAQNEFRNTPNTDWALAANRQWAESIRDKWKKRPGDPPMSVPLVVSDTEIFDQRTLKECRDLSQLPRQICVARCALAKEADIEIAIETAKADPDGWRKKDLRERHRILSQVAKAIEKARGNLMGAAAATTGKLFTESDVEVSEAVDFVEYYPHSARAFCENESLTSRGQGVGLVLSPWNFPIAIPCGGITAALAAGNTVIFKPSSDALLPAWVLCNCFWEAGVSRNTLQFLPCSGADMGNRLALHPDIDFVILTGGTATGMHLLAAKPTLHLAAETGGKNATIVTAMADRDQAVKNVIYSAFGHNGQKCSATSLLILEKEVYEDPHFRRQLVDAAKSLGVGSVWDFQNKMGPLIHPPREDLKNALTRLEPGETWALKPEPIGENPHLWSPGIKWDVSPGSYTHMTEFFGPLLAVMCADDLPHALELANQTGFGLTSGIESLDIREQEYWQAHIRAGNLYINRGTTGAVVLRQPFGGMGKSALGAGIKAGGPNYVSQFMSFTETGFPAVDAIPTDHALLQVVHDWRNKIDWGAYPESKEDLYRTARAVQSYLHWMHREFGRQKDYFHLRGQDNLLRYQPVGTVMVRLHAQDTLFDILARIAAVTVSGCRLRLSAPPDLNTPAMTFLRGREGRRFSSAIPIERQTDADVIAGMGGIDRIRYAAEDRVPEEVLREAARTGFFIACALVLVEGRIELLRYFREQSICNTYHRYGNLGDRGLTERTQ